jgi:colanic acid/amylovoran biosynthesis glycosyltransferase
MTKRVLLFTGSYPFSSASENTFIDPELPYLVSKFDEFIIVPRSLDGELTHHTLNVETSLSLLLKFTIVSKFKLLIRCILSPIFYNEILSQKLSLKFVVITAKSFAVALTTRDWVIQYIDDNDIDLANTIFYTFWIDEITFGLTLVKMEHPDMKIISRAHGGDVYEDRYLYSYIPFRSKIFKFINKVFTDSDMGRKYLSLKYPDYSNSFVTSRMGVSKQEILAYPSNDNIFRIVTCSALLPIKRINLLIDSLIQLGELTNKAFEWTHVGDGVLREELKCAAQSIPKNVKYNFIGYTPEVIRFYQTHPIDIFMNVSYSEGTPVAIMEAQSVGIPVVATAVGGNVEIVNNENGLLLPLNPTPLEIANVIYYLSNNPDILLKKRELSYKNWDESYNSDKNCSSFIDELLNFLL